MTRFSLPNSPTSSTFDIEHPILRHLRAFWRFSLYYGKFISTPVGQRKSLR